MSASVPSASARTCRWRDQQADDVLVGPVRTVATSRVICRATAAAGMPPYPVPQDRGHGGLAWCDMRPLARPPHVPSLAGLSFTAGRFEREMRDLYGIVPDHHPLPRR